MPLAAAQTIREKNRKVNSVRFAILLCATYTAHRLNLQYNPTADRQPGIFPEASL